MPNKLPKLIGDLGSNLDLHSMNVDNFFEKYVEENLCSKDYRLLKGVFWDEDLRNDELKALNYDINRSEDSEISNNNLALQVYDEDRSYFNDVMRRVE